MRRAALLPVWVKFLHTSTLSSHRYASSGVPPPKMDTPNIAEEAAKLNKEAEQLHQFNEQQDQRTAEEIRISQEIGKEAFEENTLILKSLAMRGLRAFLICAIGLGAFTIAMKRKKKEQEEVAAKALKPEDDPTARYLEEMRGLGFDVDTLEEELLAEKQENKGASAK
ncbi:hypothetical protein AGDE_03066 [Angomonas deanei]|uniref:Uncharacterized protein n=1 Tax=Angomonas deanei TaxID=59799 RepID=S9WXR0_9TRYP|nr:hypothetical protein AGDE_07668 [Angomonas deanei]EPY40860.1 hypothetical protein AGDE_03066 [Angomonas deanei]CAD2216778.1 hypothetical protein ADEAN_000425600 [Angomonas deanei]|eukprot:EPY34968.1 hypothetical protein AGDE_07668 [Angomonas deanei]